MGGSMSYVYTENTDESDSPKYGWKPDLPDHRDTIAKFNDFKCTIDLPVSIDLREKCPEIYNQGKLGSCTANAIGFLYQFDELRQKEKSEFIPSRLFIYYNEREMEGTVTVDSGAAIRDGMKSINKIGVCSEDMWKYDITKFTNKPSEDCYTFAQSHKSIKYARLGQNLNLLKKCLNSGFPFAFGISVYESFESEDVASTGNVPLPKSNEKLMGGHAIAAVGYDDNKECFIVRNSWGSDWGDNGYCYIPYTYLLNKNLANDFWKLELIEHN